MITDWTIPTQWRPTAFDETISYSAPTYTDLLTDLAVDIADLSLEFYDPDGPHAGETLSWVALDGSTINVAPTEQEFIDYHDTTMTVEIRATRVSDGVTNFDAFFKIRFESTKLFLCYSSWLFVESQDALESIFVPINSDPVMTITLPEVTDQGTLNLQATPGFENENCEPFTYTLQSALDWVTQDSEDQRVFHLEPTDNALVGEEIWVAFQVTSDAYPTQIDPLTFSVPVSVVIDTFTRTEPLTSTIELVQGDIK